MSIVGAGAEQTNSRNEHGCTPCEEAHVPQQPLLARDGLVDMMQSQKVVIDEAFHQIEGAKTDQQRSSEKLPRPAPVRAAGVSPQYRKTRGDEDLGARVKKAVEEGVCFQVREGVGGIPCA